MELVIDKLRNHPKFEQWDMIMVLDLLLSLKGINGQKAHQMAKTISEAFLKWYIGYTFGMWEKLYTFKDLPSIQQLKEMIHSSIKHYEKKSKFN